VIHIQGFRDGDALAIAGIWRRTAIMAFMNPLVTGEILRATEHLPDGSTLLVPDVLWEEYELLLEELAERPHLRLSYDCGRLEIVSPSANHEKSAEFIDDLVRAYADALDLELEKLGHTTWKREALAKGAEADACYYVGNPERILGKDTLDLEIDPPPDIVLEIDITSNSRRKFPIYAGLGVPEIWTYDGDTVRFFELVDDKYIPISESPFLPKLTGQMLAEAIEVSKTRGQKTALDLFRKRIRV
jgi:Uma2 family endonuclease